LEIKRTNTDFVDVWLTDRRNLGSDRKRNGACLYEVDSKAFDVRSSSPESMEPHATYIEGMMASVKEPVNSDRPFVGPLIKDARPIVMIASTVARA
jgi:hypothetical protein